MQNTPGGISVVGRKTDSDGRLIVDGAASRFDGGGLLVIGAGFDTDTDQVLLGSFGTGVVRANNGGTVEADQIIIGPGGNLGGNGTVTGEVINKGGEVEPGASPGILTVEGSFTQEDGTLKIEVAGTASGQFDVLTVNGTADLTGGGIEVKFVNGFVPSAGDSFTVLTSLGATLAPGVTVVFDGVAAGLQLDLSRVGNDLVVEVLSDGVAAPAPAVVAAVLPSSRSVQVGVAATAFATMINTGATEATNCRIEVDTVLPLTFLYQTTDPATNALAGTANTPVDIAPGAAQAFLVVFTPSAPFPPTDVRLNFLCDNTGEALSFLGLNTILLSATELAVIDVVALVATLSGDGTVNLAPDTGLGAFAVATVNVGGAGDIVASVDTGAATLPVSITLCETDSSTGLCLETPAATVSTSAGAGATQSFGIFVKGTENIPFDPAGSRIFVRLTDATDGTVRGATSVAVKTE